MTSFDRSGFTLEHYWGKVIWLSSAGKNVGEKLVEINLERWEDKVSYISLQSAVKQS